MRKGAFNSGDSAPVHKGNPAYPAADFRNNPTLVELNAIAAQKKREWDVAINNFNDSYAVWQKSLPLLTRLVFAARERCNCGAGMAYDPIGDSGKHSYWECSAILLGTARSDIQHTPHLSFAFYDLHSEYDLSAKGMTTRPA